MATTPPIPSRRRRGITFPVMLIVLGSLFLLNQLAPGWGLKKTWPVILVALGITKRVDAMLPPRSPKGPRV